MFWVTLAGVIAVIAYTSVAAWQACLTRGQLTEMQTTSGLMKKQLDLMDTDQRPWIHFDGLPKIVGPLEMSSPRVASLDMTFAIKNTGKNPARRVNMIYELIPLTPFDNYLAYQTVVCARVFAPKESEQSTRNYPVSRPAPRHY